MLTNKVYVITGGNAGIGKAIALELARRQAHVVIVSRNQQKGLAALQEIQHLSQHQQVDLVLGDLSTVDKTHLLATNLLKSYPQVDCLINNAGVWLTEKRMNEDGLEITFMINHLAPFILSNLLLPRLQASAPARIVNVNAGLYVNGKLDLEKTPYGADFSRLGTYANTKLGNVLFTVSLAERIANSGVTVNALHPGVIQTGLGNTTGFLGFLLRFVKRWWGKPAEGAVAPVWLATAPELATTSGKYFDQQQEIDLAENARDKNLADNLWALSVKLGRVTSP